MFKTEDVKGFSKLDKESKELFKRFCTRFYKVWEHPEDHEPVAISKANEYLKVTLNDGDWLHILKDGSWY